MTRMRYLLILCTVIGLTRPAGATVLVPADVGELAREAGAIVRGRVSEIAPRWSDDRRSIETLVTIEVESALKGPLAGTVRFLVPGGAIGRYRSVFVGAPAFSLGQHVLVFLGWRGPSHPFLLGLSQGVFRVEPDRNGSWLVTPPPVAPSGPTVRIARGDPARRPVPLAEFERRVRELVGERP